MLLLLLPTSAPAAAARTTASPATTAATGRATDAGWERIACISDPRVTVTLLVKPLATAADEQFIGFELLNKTDKPLPLNHGTAYRLGNVRRSDAASGQLISTSSGIASGNAHDLMRRELLRPLRADGAPPQQESLPPGATVRVGYSSIQVLSALGVARGASARLDGTAHFTLEVGAWGERSELISTPEGGIPFHFLWNPPDASGIALLQQRLRHVFETPGDPFGDVNLLQILLADERVAPPATMRPSDLLAALKRHGSIVSAVLLKYLDEHFAAHEEVVAFILNDVIAARNLALLRELPFATRIRDPRLIEPLVQWVREDREPFHASHFALTILSRHRALMPDRAATTSALGAIALPRTRFVSKGAFTAKEPFRWSWEVRDLVLTGDASLVQHVLPYLSHKDVTVDARMISLANNGVSTRACDEAYNAILDLLDRPGERFTLGIGFHVARPDPAAEHARRDALITKLKSEIKVR